MKENRYKCKLSPMNKAQIESIYPRYSKEFLEIILNEFFEDVDDHLNRTGRESWDLSSMFEIESRPDFDFSDKSVIASSLFFKDNSIGGQRVACDEDGKITHDEMNKSHDIYAARTDRINKSFMENYVNGMLDWDVGDNEHVIYLANDLELLKPIFELAYQRSTLENAIEENKIAIMTVNEYVNNKETKKFLSSPTSKPTPKKYYSTFLFKRIDLAQHFIGSAAITASVNGQVAKVVGEEKELSDAKGGSGFSFIDLAADKAGTRFGEMATSSPENARKIQKAMSEIKDYSDFMPDPRDLPEHMNEAEFKQRYQSVDSPAYQELSKQIDARIAAAPIYKVN